MRTPKARVIAQPAALVCAALLGTQLAQAHIQKGEAAGFLTGVRHPISGLDHVLAMIAVGLWGAQLGAPAIWILPVAFPMVMAFGGMIELMGVPLKGTEYGIAASAILLGAAVLLQIRPPLVAAAALVRMLRRLPWLCTRHRIAARSKRVALQHGFRHRDWFPACCGDWHRDGSPLEMGSDVRAGSGRRSGGCWGLLPVEGIRLKHAGKIKEQLLALTGFVLATALLPTPAQAHLNSTGMGPVYDGVAHFLLSPEDLLPVIGLALLAGLRGTAHGRRALFVLPAAWLLGGLVGLAATTSVTPIFTTFSFLLLGGLVAADAKLSLRAMTSLAVLLGLLHGYLNGAGMGHPGVGAVALLGLVFAVFALVALIASFVVFLRWPWTRVAVRVAGSWVVACGLLMLGWTARRA
jgi:urease accessory protein